eukprot:3107608-Rhodomonas_salina.1
MEFINVYPSGQFLRRSISSSPKSQDPMAAQVDGSAKLHDRSTAQSAPTGHSAQAERIILFCAPAVRSSYWPCAHGLHEPTDRPSLDLGHPGLGESSVLSRHPRVKDSNRGSWVENAFARLRETMAVDELLPYVGVQDSPGSGMWKSGVENVPTDDPERSGSLAMNECKRAYSATAARGILWL